MTANGTVAGHLCLVTVTTAAFVPGTLVLIDSFLRHNAWFDGDIAIVHDDLPVDAQRLIAAIRDGIEFLEVSPALRGRIEAAAVAVPDLAPKRARFYSLEAFRPRGYDRVLFCDSDVLFRGSIRDLFDDPHALVVCGDGYHYRGRVREWTLPSGLAGAGSQVRAYSSTFNAGLMLFDGTIATDADYDGLLRLVDSGIHHGDPAGLTDQLVLNIYYAGRQYLAGAEYNYLLRHHDAIASHSGIDLTDARVVHYNGVPKPWEVGRAGVSLWPDPAVYRALAWWFEAYDACRGRLAARTPSPLERHSTPS